MLGLNSLDDCCVEDGTEKDGDDVELYVDFFGLHHLLCHVRMPRVATESHEIVRYKWEL